MSCYDNYIWGQWLGATNHLCLTKGRLTQGMTWWSPQCFVNQCYHCRTWATDACLMHHDWKWSWFTSWMWHLVWYNEWNCTRNKTLSKLSQPLLAPLNLSWLFINSSMCHTHSHNWLPHTRLRAHDHYTPSTLISGKSGASPSLLHTTLQGSTKYVNARWCKVHMDSYMASNGACFMVTWIIFQNHLLEVGLTQNQETMALRTLTTIDLFYFIMCEDFHE